MGCKLYENTHGKQFCLKTGDWLKNSRFQLLVIDQIFEMKLLNKSITKNYKF